MNDHHESHRDRAELARASCADSGQEAIVIGLFTIADRLADLADLLETQTEILAAQVEDGETATTAPRAAESVLEEQYRAGSG